tara:strand:- start:120 stop:425 length:306 start_codon:yes stop_codon:yes gene_type:complete
MHLNRLILEVWEKIKDYLNKINNPVKTNNTASRYSIIFFVFSLFMNFLNPLPNNAHKLHVGKLIIAAVIVTNMTPIKIFSSDGKNPEATVTAIDQAFGFIN